MGYLDNSTITVDAILTKKGRELLARGRNEFQISQFALADDEVDYDLYNSEHPLGTAFYGAAIENLPVTEALPDETQMMKYKLVTLAPGTARIPVVTIPGIAASPIIQSGGIITITPQTQNFNGGNSRFGYTAILSDSAAGSIVATKTAPQQTAASIPQFVGDSEAAQSVTVSGMEFQFTGGNQLISDSSATILIIGNETGGRASMSVTVKKLALAVTPSAPVNANQATS
tara:strand:+ start:27802 stop:28491 length:690 start_codon:yes stop_codon:yes gene_type:complete